MFNDKFITLRQAANRDINPANSVYVDVLAKFEQFTTDIKFTPKNSININCIKNLLAVDLQGAKYDLIKCFFALHRVNNIEGVMHTVKSISAGMFAGALFGMDNLHQLATASINLQSKTLGDVRPMVLPCVDIKAFGMLLQDSGFKKISLVNYTYNFEFENIAQLMRFAQQVGGANCITGAVDRVLPKKFFKKLEKEYLELYKDLTASFDVIMFVCFAE